MVHAYFYLTVLLLRHVLADISHLWSVILSVTHCHEDNFGVANVIMFYYFVSFEADYCLKI